MIKHAPSVKRIDQIGTIYFGRSQMNSSLSLLLVRLYLRITIHT